MVPEVHKKILEELKRFQIDTALVKKVEKDLPREFFFVPVTSEQATGVWHAIRAVHKETGFWPILVQNDGVMDELFSTLERHDEDFEGYFEETVSEGLAIDFKSWLKLQEPEPQDNDELMGEWPEEAEPAHVLVQLLDLRVDEEGRFAMQQLSEVLLVLCPLQEPWQLPALLKLGGWNACPDAPHHVAGFKYWYERYAAEPAFFSYDTFEFIVNNPPIDNDSALELAIDQYYYCYDLVAQGCGSILELAGNLVDSTVWYFWWD
jgi:hypothetical protein